MEPCAPGTYPLSLHDALPIFGRARLVDQRTGDLAARRHRCRVGIPAGAVALDEQQAAAALIPHVDLAWLGIDRKSTRLNSSHVRISYAVFCLKKKKKKKFTTY